MRGRGLGQEYELFKIQRLELPISIERYLEELGYGE